MMKGSFNDAVFYHIYPLGCSGAPFRNDFQARPVPRLAAMLGWVDHLRDLGVNALYIGPLFESSTHGYDTRDYFTLDRRLGTNEDLKEFVAACHRSGIAVVLDAVFNHVGRDHEAFRDLLNRGEGSPFRDWFHVDFSRHSCQGDPFFYEGWRNHFDLVKLNLANPQVREHLFSAVSLWIKEFDIDGLRLDAADCIDRNFFRALRPFCRGLKSGFWLLGEVIHGNYRDWANDAMLDSITNYECYKGLWSSHNDRNYFEIAWSLNRQFGNEGIYRNLPLYNFADNHDVDRVATILRDRRHLYPLYTLLFSMPGIPSLYYGSDWGVPGKKANGSDADLRPAIDIREIRASLANNDLQVVIGKLIAIRKRLPPLSRGDYRQLHVAAQQFCFMRQSAVGASAVVAVNAEEREVTIEPPLPLADGLRMEDLLGGETFTVRNGKLRLLLPPNRGRILAPLA